MPNLPPQPPESAAERPLVARRNDLAFERESGGLARLALAALLAGAATGIAGATFRYALLRAEQARVDLLAWAHDGPSWGWVISVLLGATCMAAARWLVRFAPEASGSGVQHVEAVAAGEAEPASPAVIPVKFVGGVLAIGSGMVLGREGPTVQMGATLGVIVARWLRMRLEDIRDLQTACGGAGLGVAFNAPMGGALFVFEEVDRRFGMRLTLATLLAAGTAISVARYLLGVHVELPIAALPDAQPHELIPYVLLGVLLGFAGLAYNRTVILALDVYARVLARWTPEAKAAVVGGVVGLVAWFVPPLVGGGETLSVDVLHGTVPLTMLLMLFVLRWLLGALCYAPGAPGGLFAPLLLVGAIGGACFAILANRMLPMLDLNPASFAVVAMAAFFTAVVRAPLTGIVLVVEMTAATSMIVPSFIACFSAMFTASVLRGEPIYDSLRTRMFPGRRQSED